MLNRRILRIKVFKVLFECASNRDITLKEATERFDASVEASRDLYLFIMSLAIPLTEEASRRIEAARSKFNPTPEDLNPNMKFVRNRIAPMLSSDPEFQKLLARKKFSWEQYDVLVREVLDSMTTKPWFREYMDSEEDGIAADARLFGRIFEEELEFRDDLAEILQDMSLGWNDDLSYVLSFCSKSLMKMARDGRWTLPPLYNSELLSASGKPAEDDRKFAHDVLKAAYANSERYMGMISSRTVKWEPERLYLPDVVLIAQGLAEAEFLPGIPLSVTINEYVDISYCYGTPKSSTFVNGILDRLVGELVSEGKISGKTVK